MFRMAAAGKVDISDLTWEQKEKVLRYLFAKINGSKERRQQHTAPPSLKGEPNRFTEPEREAW